MSAEATPVSKRQRRPRVSEDGSSSTLIVRNLPTTATSAEFNTFFSTIAPVQHAFVVTKKTDSGIQGEGFGFVTFADKADAVKLAGKSNIPWTTSGITLSVAFAKPRQRRQAENEKEKHVQVSKDPNLPSLRPRLIFRNMSWKLRTPEQLEKVLAPWGKPKEIRIPRAKGGRMTGFAFVEMKTRKAAGKVIEHVNGMEIEGRQVAVDWCVNKDEWTQHHKATAREEPIDEDDDDDEPIQIDEEKVKTEDEDDGILEEDSESELLSNDEEQFPEPTSQTLFIRNIPYLVTRATLFDLFRPLGHIASLYVVTDPQSGLSRGTAFLTFSSPGPAESLLELYGRIKTNQATPEEIEKYTLEGRVLDFLPAVNRDEATRLKDEHATKKHDDKRNIFLLKEGDIAPRHPFFSSLSTMDLSLRRDSMKQRKDMLAANPSLHLSLTRLAVRNIPRSMTETELRKLAIKAVAEYDEEVKSGLREALTEEEIARDKFEIRGKLVRQAKIVLEKTGRSKGYGFIEYDSHANALKGLRWLNARVMGERQVEEEGDRKRRLLVEFALENAQVVKRRKEREEAARRKAFASKEAEKNKKDEHESAPTAADKSGKRKRDGKEVPSKSAKKRKSSDHNAGEGEKVGSTDVGKIIGAKRFRRKLERGRKGK
jgi:nucleolar protein 4